MGFVQTCARGHSGIYNCQVQKQVYFLPYDQKFCQIAEIMAFDGSNFGGLDVCICFIFHEVKTLAVIADQ